MKTIKILGLLLVTTFVFASCSKDDEKAIQVEGTTWETTYYKVKMGPISQEFKTKSELETFSYYEVLEFKAGGKYFEDGVESGTWAQSGSKVTVTYSGDLDEPLVYSVSGDKLELKDSFTEGGIKVEEIIRYSQK